MKFEKSVICEIQFNQVPANGSEIKFGENMKISSKDFQDRYEVYGILVYDRSTLLKSPEGRPIVTDVKGLAFTLFAGNTEKHFLVPSKQFYTAYNGGFFYELKPFSINYPISSIKVLDNTGISTGDSFCFVLVYRDKKR